MLASIRKVRSTCSWARMGLPAATRPISGSESCARLGKGRLNCLPRAWLSARNVSDCRRMPRDVPPTSSITPLRASACRCSSAAFADWKPSSVAISARVGGAPVRSIALCTRSRICCWRAVSFGVSTSMASSPSGDSRLAAGIWLFIQGVFLSKVAKNAKPHAACRDSRHGRDDRRHRLHQHRHHRLPGRRAGRRALIAAVPALAEHRIESESVAAIDSKNMDAATWQRLAARVAHHVARPEVAGVVVTHGTDTLEETAYFLHRVLAPAKPVVLTAAMRPATALSPDGPANLLDAVTVAESPAARGVSVVFAGAAWHPVGLRKVHTLQANAFSGSDCGPI